MPNNPETVFYGETPIRTFTMNGKTTHAARDLCGILGYSAPHKMLDRFVKAKPEYIDVVTNGGTQKLRVVEREDIEQVLTHSRHRNVAKLRDWLRKDVKPAGKRKPMATKPGVDEYILLVVVFD